MTTEVHQTNVSGTCLSVGLKKKKIKSLSSMKCAFTSTDISLVTTLNQSVKSRPDCSEVKMVTHLFTDCEMPN